MARAAHELSNTVPIMTQEEDEPPAALPDINTLNLNIRSSAGERSGSERRSSVGPANTRDKDKIMKQIKQMDFKGGMQTNQPVSAVDYASIINKSTGTKKMQKFKLKDRKSPNKLLPPKGKQASQLASKTGDGISLTNMVQPPAEPESVRVVSHMNPHDMVDSNQGREAFKNSPKQAQTERIERHDVEALATNKRVTEVIEQD